MENFDDEDLSEFEGGQFMSRNGAHDINSQEEFKADDFKYVNRLSKLKSPYDVTKRTPVDYMITHEEGVTRHLLSPIKEAAT